MECVSGEVWDCDGDGVDGVAVFDGGVFVWGCVVMDVIPKRVVKVGGCDVGDGRGTGVVGGFGGSNGGCCVLVCGSVRDWC